MNIVEANFIPENGIKLVPLFKIEDGAIVEDGGTITFRSTTTLSENNTERTHQTK